MAKPTVFFSHSSRDRDVVGRLKELFLAKTGGSIDLFVSSDGQSIPFGRNWVHEVEQALGRCQLLFVFLTPESLRSHWVFFEAGYTYSKSIKVVPVGLIGVDLNTVPPPLSLLQGFNIVGAAGLNNLIAVTNAVLSHQHLESFTDDEFRHVVGTPAVADGSTFGIHGALLDEFIVSNLRNTGGVKGGVELAAKVLEAEAVPFVSVFNGISAIGILVTSSEVKGDPVLAVKTIPLALRLGRALVTVGTPLQLMLFFRPGIEREPRLHRVTAALHDAGVVLSERQDANSVEGILEWNGIQFSVAREHSYGDSDYMRRCFLHVRLHTDELSLETLSELVKLLFERGVLRAQGGDAV
jgi:hypothetical protein